MYLKIIQINSFVDISVLLSVNVNIQDTLSDLTSYCDNLCLNHLSTHSLCLIEFYKLLSLNILRCFTYTGMYF